jgi:predicted nucleic acid-binding protein
VGLILDSSVLIAAERKGSNARQAMTAIARRVPSQDIAMSVVTLMELAHGAARADTPERKALRLQFLREIAAAAPVHRITVPIALRAGRVDGESTARGIRFPLADLLIGATALEVGYSIATANLRHFRLIPGLNVIAL